jgi:hypothetical protein
MARPTFEQAVAYIERAGRVSIEEIDRDKLEASIAVVEQRARALQAELDAANLSLAEAPPETVKRAEDLADVLSVAADVSEKLPEPGWLETGPMSHLTRWTFSDVWDGITDWLAERERAGRPEPDPSQRRKPGGGRPDRGPDEETRRTLAVMRGRLAQAANRYGIDHSEVEVALAEAERIATGRLPTMPDGTTPLPFDAIADLTVADFVDNTIEIWATEHALLRGPPIGVPEGFAARRDIRLDPADRVLFEGRPESAEVEVEPRYFEGDEWNLAGLPPEEVVVWQRRLVDAGLMEPDSYHPGVWTDIDAGALRIALGAANGSGAAVDDQLDDMASNLPLSVVEARRRKELERQFQAPPYLAPDYTTLAQDVKAAVRQRLRRDPTEQEMAELTAAMSGFYRADYEAEVAALRSAFDAEGQGLATGQAVTPGTVTDLDPASMFRQLFDQRFGPEMEFAEGQQENLRNTANVLDSLRTLGNMVAS